mmetsp:Transcript_63733/g.137061  ORF Transcript_63733/g.137061 Transcript_63733/m.137061 type:complete len:235 (+) Transcript_63733:56-760(+)
MRVSIAHRPSLGDCPRVNVPSLRSDGDGGGLVLGLNALEVEHLPAGRATSCAAALRDLISGLPRLVLQRQISPALDEDPDHVAQAVARGRHQGRATGRRGNVHIRTRVHERLRGCFTAAAHSVAERRPTVGVLSIDGRPGVEQLLHLGSVVGVRGHHQRRCAPLALVTRPAGHHYAPPRHLGAGERLTSITSRVPQEHHHRGGNQEQWPRGALLLSHGFPSHPCSRNTCGLSQA